MSNFEFKSAYNKHYPAFYSFALKLTNNRSDAMDLLQETSLKAYKYLHSFRPGTNFKSWVNTILKNTFVNNYHKKEDR